MTTVLRRSTRSALQTLPVLAAALLISSAVCTPAQAGKGANFITYDHHTSDKGESEVELWSDFGKTDDGESYLAQLLEFEHGVTDFWTVSAYLESHRESGEDYEFDGFRLESRYRLLPYGAFLNPVIYTEYINKKEGALYLREAVGRTDEHEGGEEEEEDEDAREHEFETKLILGHDFSDRLSVGFNWVNEVNLKTGDWEFGYATGLNYTLFEVEGEHEGGRDNWNVKELKLGLEFFGGLGDSVKGLTFDSDKTEQYAGISLKTEFANGAEVTVGGAFGLTDDSQDAILRTAVGWEFE